MSEASPPTLQEQLSRLQGLLRDKQEICSSVARAAEEQGVENKRSKEAREARSYALQQKLAQIVSEQEGERNRQGEVRATGQGNYLLLCSSRRG